MSNSSSCDHSDGEIIASEKNKTICLPKLWWICPSLYGVMQGGPLF